MRSYGRILARIAPQVKADKEQRMVLQVGADTRTIDEHVDTDGLEMLCRSDAGLHEHGRRMDAASTEDHLAGTKLLSSVPEFYGNPDDTAPRAQEVCDLGIAQDR